MAKDKTPTTPSSDGLDELAAHFRIDPALFRSAIHAGVETGQLQVTAADSGAEPALRGIALLTRLVKAQVPALHPEGPQALGAVATALTRRAELRPIAWEHAEARPAIAGLPEAALDWALLKEEQGQRLGLAPARIDELKFLGATVPVKRAYLEVAIQLQRAFEADLAVDENRVRTLLDADVTPLRAALEQNPELARKSERVRDYLYGPAQRGADTRADLAQKRRTWTAQATTTARVAGIDEGMRRMEEKVKAALDGADDPAADPDPADRRDPRR